MLSEEIGFWEEICFLYILANWNDCIMRHTFSMLSFTGNIYCIRSGISHRKHFYLEGGLIYVLLGVLFWIFKDQKKKLAVSYCIFDVLLFGLTTTSIISLSLGWLRFHFPILTVPLEVVGYLLDTVIGLPPVELVGSMW